MRNVISARELFARTHVSHVIDRKDWVEHLPLLSMLLACDSDNG